MTRRAGGGGGGGGKGSGGTKTLAARGRCFRTRRRVLANQNFGSDPWLQGQESPRQLEPKHLPEVRSTARSPAPRGSVKLRLYGGLSVSEALRPAGDRRGGHELERILPDLEHTAIRAARAPSRPSRLYRTPWRPVDTSGTSRPTCKPSSKGRPPWLRWSSTRRPTAPPRPPSLPRKPEPTRRSWW